MNTRERPIRTETLSYKRRTEPKQLGTDRPEWRPKRLGYAGRQWSNRPVTELQNELRVTSFRKQQPFASTVTDLGRGGKTPREYLTDNGFKLLKVVALGDRDMEALSWYAKENELDLTAALEELRGYELLDESDPEMVALAQKSGGKIL